LTRLQVLAAHPRRTLGALAVVLTAVGITAGSGANFSATSANPNNVFSSGTLSIDNSKEGSAILSATGLKPAGPWQNGTVDIQNSGSMAADFTLSRAVTSDPGTLAPKLNLKVTDCGLWTGSTPSTCEVGDDLVYSGPLSDMPATGTGSFAAGDKHRYLFEVQLDGSAGDSYQGKTAIARFDWRADQS
jgi:hypothetical protein